MEVALVLGARGFLGRHVVRALGVAQELQVVESDLPAAGRREPADFVALDLLATEPPVIAAALGKCGAGIVVNCAGRTSGSESELYLANVETTVRLIAALQLMDAPPRLIHIGSAAEYGPKPEGVPVREDAATQPVSPYGAWKLAATRLVCDSAERGAVRGLVLRVFNAVGPGMPAQSLTGAALAQLRQAEVLGLREIQMGPMGAVRDFVDVRDIGTAVAAACVADWGGARVVNVGTGQAHTARELVEALARRIGYRGAIAETAPGSERSANVPWMVADVSLAQRVLGWRAVHDLDSIAANVVAGED